MLVVVPSRPLAMQTAITIYGLVGGNVRGHYFPGDKATLFNYEGPKGLRICAMASNADKDHAVDAAKRRSEVQEKERREREKPAPPPRPRRGESADDFYEDIDAFLAESPGLAKIFGGGGGGGGSQAQQQQQQEEEEEEVPVMEETEEDLYPFDDLEDCDVLVADVATLKEAVMEAKEYGPLFGTSQLEFFAIDEADVIGADAALVAKELGIRKSTRRVLVGATLNPKKVQDLLEHDRSAALVEPGFVEQTNDEATLGTGVALPKNVQHQYILVEKDEDRLATIARAMRSDVDKWEALGKNLTEIPRPRCVVFCPDEATATLTAKQLRNAVWGKHAVAALLPTVGGAPVESARSFVMGDDSTESWANTAARNAATALVTSVRSARGLDFPNVTHVFCLGADFPPSDYIHMAGRTGRVGQLAKGTVTTVANQTDVELHLKANFRTHFDALLTEAPQPPEMYLDLPGYRKPRTSSSSGKGFGFSPQGKRGVVQSNKGQPLDAFEPSPLRKKRSVDSNELQERKRQAELMVNRLETFYNNSNLALNPDTDDDE